MYSEKCIAWTKTKEKGTPAVSARDINPLDASFPLSLCPLNQAAAAARCKPHDDLVQQRPISFEAQVIQAMFHELGEFVEIVALLHGGIALQPKRGPDR